MIAIIGIGIPGSGKSTYLKPMAKEKGYVYVNADEIREKVTGDPLDHSKEKIVQRILYDSIASALPETGVIIDTTQSKIKYRKSMVIFCREHGAQKVIGYWFDVPLEIAIERNKKRSRNVPEEAMHMIHNRLSMNPPSLDDGFDEIIEFKT